MTVLPLRRLGRTPVQVTELGFGAAPIAGLYEPVPEEAARAAVDAAWDSGIRYFDTAPHYGVGLAERRLGAALRGLPRDELVVSTKVGRLLVPNQHPTGRDAHGFAVRDDVVRRWDFTPEGVRLDGPGGPSHEAANGVLLLTGYRSDTTLLRMIGAEVDPIEGAPIHHPETYETSVPNVYVIGAFVAGKQSGRIFIENGRFHGEVVVNVIAQRIDDTVKLEVGSQK